MRLADRYDVVCTAGGLSSYLCAALLAKSGRRVLVIDEQNNLQKTFGNRYLFDPDFPSFCGLDESSALGLSLAQLGLKSIVPRFHPLESVLQVLGPEYRIVFGNSADNARREILRELPIQGREVWKFFERIYKAGQEVSSFVESAVTPGQGSGSEAGKWKRFWGNYYSAVKSSKAISLSHILADAGAEECERLGLAMLGALSYSSPVNLGAEQCIRSLPVLLKGQYFFEGGGQALKKELAKVIREAGGDIKENTQVESLITDQKKIIGVLLTSHEGIVRSDIIVLGGSLKRIYSTLPMDIQDPSVVRGLNRLRASHWRYTLSLAVNREVLPIGVSSNMIHVRSYQDPLEEENFLRLQVLPAGVFPDAESRDVATLFVTALIPYRASAMDYHYLRRLAGKMMRTVSEVIPFLEYNIVDFHPDFRADEIDLNESYPFRGPDWLPESLMQYYVQGSRGSQDFWGPSWTTPHSNLYFAGRSIWPSLGAYGEVLSARKVFEDLEFSFNEKTGALRDMPAAEVESEDSL